MGRSVTRIYLISAPGESSRRILATSEREALEALGLPVIRNSYGRLMAVNPAGALFNDDGIWTATEEE